MTLTDLGTKLTNALRKLSSSTVLNDEVLQQFLNSFSLALLQADLDVTTVKQLQVNIRSQYAELTENKAVNKRKLLNGIVERELVKLVSAADEKQLYRMEKKKGKTHRVLFLGLQGAGKTTTCGKYALFYKRKGWKVGIIAADTFRAGAYDQAKSNALKVGVNFYGKQDEKDPARVVELGLQAFQNLALDLIIVDTAGRHVQEASLFEEMHQITQVFQPDDTLFVMDASIGKSIAKHAEAFANAAPIGSIVLTKMDGGAKGGGALMAIQKTKSPVSFIGTGEHMTDLSPFNPRSFVNRLLGGCGDVRAVMDSMDTDKLKAFHEDVMHGKDNVTFEHMKRQMEQMFQLGGLTALSQMLPNGMITKSDTDSAGKQMKQSMVVFDSMTKLELKSTDKLFHKEPGRIQRLVRGSGVPEKFVRQLIDSFKNFNAMQSQMRNMGTGAPGKGMKMPDMAQIQRMMTPANLETMMRMMRKR